MTDAFGFADVLRDVERALVEEASLTPVPLPPELATMDGVYRDAPVRLEARAYHGPKVRLARFVELTGPTIEIANVLCFPQPPRELPVFGADLVGIGRDTAAVIADLTPLTSDAAERQRQLGVLRRHRALRASLHSSEELPAWAVPWFSSEALYARVPAGEDVLVRASVQTYARAFAELLHTPSRSDDPVRVADRQAAYCAAHREQDRGLGLLHKIIAPPLADRLVREVLFPERLPS